MKRIVKYTLIFIITMLAFIYKVNAGFNCNKSITIHEDSNQAQPAGFNATLSMCIEKPFDGTYNIIHTTNKYPDAVSYAYEWLTGYYSGTDNKSIHAGKFQRCNDPMAKVHATAYYYLIVPGTPVFYNCNTLGTEAQCQNHSEACYYYRAPSSNDNNSGGGGSGGSSGHGANYPSSGMLEMSTKTSDNIKGISPESMSSVAVLQDGCHNRSDHPNGYRAYTASGQPLYSCDSGFSPYKVGKCRKQYSMDFGTECITNGYHASGGRCAAGGNDPSPMSRRNQDLLDRATAYCSYYYAANGEGKWCESDKVIYDLYCPVYKCDVQDKTISACTPTFTAGNTTAYCVNPHDHFSKSGGTTSDYVPETVDVSSCSNSYNTIDCGYSNILIEGNYKKVSNKAIELAMRLWGVHTGRSGFGGVGLSNRQGSNCGTGAWFVWRNGVLRNVYKETYRYIMNNFFSWAHEQFVDGYIDVVDESNGFGITCSSISGTVIANASKYAVACGNTSVQKQGVALFFNTLLGNKYMKEHLYSVHGIEGDTTPIYAEITEDGKDQHSVWVTFEEETFEKTFDEVYEKTNKEVINCDWLNKQKNVPEYKDLYNKVAPYCQVRTTILNADGVVLDEGRVDECQKGVGCRRIITLTGYAVCSNSSREITPVKIKTTYKKTIVNESVIKYLPCGGAGYQFLYAFKYPQTGSEKRIDINKIETTERGETTFEITPLICEGTFCNDPAVIKDGDNKCSNKLNNYDGKFTKSIKDPSLKCIMKMRNLTDKARYDYSERFNVNTNLCRIYCSDEVSYVIADKVKERSARNFKFNISFDKEGFKDIPLSSYIKEKRTCVSEIYYNNPIQDIDEVNRRYNLNLKYGANWKTLADALAKKARDEENSRGDNINQIVYDLYNCNLFSSNNNNFGNVTDKNDSAPVKYDSNGKVTGPFIRKPQDNKTGNVRKTIENEYSASNAYGLDKITYDCEFNVNGSGKITRNTCLNHDTIKYSDYAAEVDAKENGVQMGSTSTAATSVSNIKYCSGSGCFDYKENDSNPYKYGKSDTKNHVTSKTFSLRNLGFSTINIPTNDYAYFDIEVEVGFFNDSRFAVEPNTGNVYYSNSSNSNYLVNEAYTFPTSKNAYNSCSKLEEESGVVTLNEALDFNKTYRRCEINQVFNKIATFNRNVVNDEFTNAIKESQTFTCYVDVLIPTPAIDKLYRNVDPANMFPYEESIGLNWKTEVGQAARTQIETTAESIKNGDELLDYRITLTPNEIKNIKKYNETAPQYANEPIDTSTCKHVEDIDSNDRGYYYDCKSKFLEAMKQGKGGSNSLGTIEDNTPNRKKE